MALKRKLTKNILVLQSGTGTKALTLRELEDIYRAEGALSIGSHYVIDREGDVLKARHEDEHPNAHPRYNKDSVVIEVLCCNNLDMNEAQKAALSGAISVLQDKYPEAEELNLIP